MQRIVYIGIGGIGLSAIAHIMLDCGIKNIIGIDGNIHQDSLTSLKEKGLELYEHGFIECAWDDIVLYSDAVFNSIEYQTYKEMGARMYSYFAFAGTISQYFKTISVAGSHGKSTTTAIGISALHKTTPNFALGIVGTLMKEFNGANYYINPDYKVYIQNIIHGVLSNSKIVSPGYSESIPLFIIEADEFNRHFHLLDTDIALITNIEHDHTDIYPSKKDYLDAFGIFMQNTKSAIIAHPNGIAQIIDDDDFKQRIYLTQGKQFKFQHIFGDHNQSNANLILSLLQYLGIYTEEVVLSIESFPGIRRRQELLLKNDNGALYSDYAHHPSEILATYNALHSHYPDKNIIGIFQPHQAARVLEFEKEFIESILGFNECFIFPIYAARENFDMLGEKYPELARSGSFYEYSKGFAKKCGAQFIESYDDARELIKKKTSNSIVVIMTAGNLDWEIRKKILH